MKKNKGFTLIELMIVIAIIAIIAAIAIPNLMRSRVLANETTAASVLGQYRTAQVTFEEGMQNRVVSAADTFVNSTAGNTFTDNFRNLHYGYQKGEGLANRQFLAATGNIKLNLLSQAIADAYALTPVGIATTGAVAQGAGGATAYHGYTFTEPTDVTDATFSWDSMYALCAVPALSGNTGETVMYVGATDQNIYVKGLDKGKAPPGLTGGSDVTSFATSPITAPTQWVSK